MDKIQKFDFISNYFLDIYEARGRSLYSRKAETLIEKVTTALWA